MVLSRIPKWILIGAGILSFVSGMVNTIAILGFTHHVATHMTGLFSLASILAFQGEAAGLWQISGILISFFSGAILSGFLLRDDHLKMGRRYEWVMLIEGTLLLAAAWGLSRQIIWGEYAAAAAAGLQNAMASTYSGAIIRTTHLTGILTDLGVLVGHRLRGSPPDKLKIKLFITLILAFVMGGYLGAWCYLLFEAFAMLIPAALIFFCAVSYRLLRQKEAESVK